MAVGRIRSATLLAGVLVAAVIPACSGDGGSVGTGPTPPEPALVDSGLPLSAAIGFNDDGVPTVAGLAPGENLVTMVATLAIASRMDDGAAGDPGDLERLEEAIRERIGEMSGDLEGGSESDEVALFADVLLLARGVPRLMELVPGRTLGLLAEAVAVEPEGSVTHLRLRSGLLVAGSPVAPPTGVLDARLCLAAQVTTLGYTDALPLLAGEIGSGRLSCVVEMVERLGDELAGDPPLTPAQASNLSLGGIEFDRSVPMGELRSSIASGEFPPNETLRLLARIVAGSGRVEPMEGLAPLVSASVETLAGLPEVGPVDSPLEAYLYAELDAALGRPLWSSALEPTRILAASGVGTGPGLVAGTELPPGASCDERLGALLTSARAARSADPVLSGIPPMRPWSALSALPPAVDSCDAALGRLGDPRGGALADVWGSIYAGCAVAQTDRDERELRRRAGLAVGQHAVDWDFVEDPYDASAMFDHYALDWLAALADGSCGELTLWEREAS
ncbi:MAG: hypothetical protein R2716_13240 [Microthrixaceae bacterium]